MADDADNSQPTRRPEPDDELATRRAKRPQFSQIPYWVDDLGLSDNAFRIYMKLNRRAYRMGERQTLVATLSNAELQKMSRKSERTVTRGLVELDTAGAIIIRRSRSEENGTNNINQYVLPDEPPGK